MFLTATELHELSGYRQPSKQIEWLRTNRVRHWIARTGHPKVPRSAIDGALNSPDDEKPFELGHVA